MSLRAKTLLLGILSLMVLIAISFAALQLILPSSYARLEEQETREDAARAMDALSLQLIDLERTTADWAWWDDTYNFIEDANANYIQANLMDPTFINLNLDLMVFVHSSGRLVFGKSYDLSSRQEVPMPPSLQAHLELGSSLLSHPDLTSVKTGILSLPEGPLLVSAMPILTSQEQGPIRGTLLMGRFLDAAEIARLARTTHLTLTIHRLDEPQLPSDFQIARSEMSDQTMVIVSPRDEQTVVGYSLVKDIYGKPALILAVETVRAIYQQGKLATAHLMLAMFAIGVVFNWIVFNVVEQFVLARLSRLNHDVQRIGAGGDPARRVSIPGKDEISSLANEINRMLRAIEQSQQAQRGSEERFRALIENSSDLILVMDRDGTVCYASPALNRAFGYQPQETLKRSVLEFIHPDDHPIVVDALKHRLTHPGSSDQHMQVRVREKKGSVRVMQAIGMNLLDNPAVAGIVINCRDVTERQRAEQSLQESNARFHALIEGIADLVYLKDAQGRNLYVNQAYVDFFGLPRSEVIGKRDDQLLPPELAQRCMASDAAVLQMAGLVRLEEPGTARNGTRVFFETTKNPVFDATGRVVGLVGISHDITERKQYSEHLEQTVVARTRELSDTQEQLIRQERLAVLGQLAGGIAHELRSPLSAIKNAAYYFKMVVEHPSSDAREMMEILDQQIDVSARIISRLLDFARPKAPSLRLTPLMHVVEAAICQCKIPQDITVVCQADEDLPQLKIDVEQMQLVFSNLITNAVQAMPQGGQLTIAFQPVGNKMQVKFIDTGVGIVAEALDKIFQPLYTTKAKGIGLGLALSQLIVEAHDGAIEVTSEVGKGSTFCVSLPLPDRVDGESV